MSWDYDTALTMSMKFFVRSITGQYVSELMKFVYSSANTLTQA